MTNNKDNLAAEAAQKLSDAGLLTLYEKGILKQTKSIIVTTIEKATTELRQELDEAIADAKGLWQDCISLRAGHASEQGADDLLRDIRAGTEGSRGRCLTCDSIAVDIDKHLSQRPTPATEICPDCNQPLTGDEMIDHEVHGRCSPSGTP